MAGEFVVVIWRGYLVHFDKLVVGSVGRDCRTDRSNEEEKKGKGIVVVLLVLVWMYDDVQEPQGELRGGCRLQVAD